MLALLNFVATRRDHSPRRIAFNLEIGRSGDASKID
jgi:hypothetical protein